MEHLGIVGYPNVGKSTLFNALTGLDTPTARYPFSTSEAHVGVAVVPDPLLDRAAALEGSEKVAHATLELLDLPAGHGGSLSPEMLGRLREVEALIAVVRAFEDVSIPADESGTDPVQQAENLTLELTLADAEVFGRRSERAAKEATADPSHQREALAISKAAAAAESGTPLRAERWTDEERAYFRDSPPLSLKPTIWVVNVAEESSGSEWEAKVRSVVPSDDVVLSLSAEIEEEAARLDPEDRAELFEGLGLGEGALATIVHAAYQALGLISFYTINPNEAHAWAVRRATRARDAAGKVHSDLERGFIRAEIATIHELIEAGGWEAAKAAGSVRVEGQDYEIAEGDVMMVRFSV